MKKVLFILFNLLTITVMAQEKGRFEVHDLGSFKLHVYYTNDALGDASYIIEGGDALVKGMAALDHFGDIVRPVQQKVRRVPAGEERRITDYHVGGTGSHEIVMAEGMPAFTKGEIYGGMMQGFAQAFGDALTDMPTGKATEVPFGTVQTWAGVTFGFSHGAASDFPGASILIGGKAYYTHWTPAKAHVSHLQVSSRAAIDAEIAEASESLSSGAELFIGGHGGAAGRDAVEFKIAYLNKMKEVLDASPTAQAFVAAMKEAYPGLPGEAGLEELGKALY